MSNLKCKQYGSLKPVDIEKREILMGKVLTHCRISKSKSSTLFKTYDKLLEVITNDKLPMSLSIEIKDEKPTLVGRLHGKCEEIELRKIAFIYPNFVVKQVVDFDDTDTEKRRSITV